MTTEQQQPQQPPPPSSSSQGTGKDIDESCLPRGQCRYILLLPEVKGQRCGCVGFSLNRSMPSATCDCGHLACYHVKATESQPDKLESEQLKSLMQRVKDLEEQLDREKEGSLGSLVTRVSLLEETVDLRNQEVASRIDESYKLISRALQDIHQLSVQTTSIQEHVSRAGLEIAGISNRNLELADATEQLEERLDLLETREDRSLDGGRHRRNSTSDFESQPARLETSSNQQSSAAQVPAEQLHPPRSIQIFPSGSAFMAYRGRQLIPTSSDTWTAHISLLPSATLPFPFEKDTNAYKRCLSRGLHQQVVIPGPDSRSFEVAVLQAFGRLLQGRPWVPLQAKPCNAEQLQGLPMLRQMEAELVNSDYDLEFLKRHCAVRDSAGRIDSLYIAMRADSLSWHFLRHSPVVKEGLEDSWCYDPLLDLNGDDESIDETKRPAAGDIVPNLPGLSQNLKRGASEISRSSSFGATPIGTENDSSRTKMARTAHMQGLVEAHRRAERV